MTTSGDNPVIVRPARKTSRGRLVAAVVIIVLGVAAIVYGAVFHFIPVLAEPETKADESPDQAALAVFGLAPEVAAPAPGTAAGTQPGKELVAKDEPEPAIVQAVTVGDAVRMPSGEIKRTYGGTQCPT